MDGVSQSTMTITTRDSNGKIQPNVDMRIEAVAGGEIVDVVGRLSAKNEAPLVQLISGGSPAVSISTLADVTFYGQDQTGREVTVTGTISVDFANWGDPDQ